MAVTTNQSNNVVTIVYDDISTDFPTTGIAVPNRCGILTEAVPSGATLTVEFTCDDPTNLAAATWVTYKTVAAGSTFWESFDFSPTAIRLTCTASTCKAWVKLG